MRESWSDSNRRVKLPKKQGEFENLHEWGAQIPAQFPNAAHQYARQESNSSANVAEKPHLAGSGGAQSGALSNDSASPTLSLLLKLTAGLTPDELAVLARSLAQSEGESPG